MERGLKFPFEISKQHGQVQVSEFRENIRQSVEIILQTEPGERVLHPQFGTKLQPFLFENMDGQTEEMIRREVRHSLSIWEKRIWDIEVEIDKEPERQGELHIAVTYRMAGTQERERVEITR